MDSVEARVIRLETKFKIMEREVAETRLELDKAVSEIRTVSTELKLSAMEMRSAIALAISTATKPMENLSWGWRVLVGVGSAVLGVVVFIGGLVGIVDHFTKT